MSSLKEIRRRIGSVSNTKQITRAMKLVSAAKLRRAQDAALTGRDYSARLNSVVAKLLGELSGKFEHPLAQPRAKVAVRRVVVISGERGLCGSYNASVIKAVQAEDLSSENESNAAAKNAAVKVEILPIGRRTVSSAKYLKWNTVGTYESLPENAADWPIEQMASELIRDFTSGACDEVVVYYTKFVSAMNQQVQREVLLPLGSLGSADDSEEQADSTGVVKFSPEPAEILANLIPVLVAARLRGAGLESKASEHAARMTAMDAATNNASELIDKLRLHYNRARQSTITTELIDIVGGAEALQ